MFTMCLDILALCLQYVWFSIENKSPKFLATRKTGYEESRVRRIHTWSGGEDRLRRREEHEDHVREEACRRHHCWTWSIVGSFTLLLSQNSTFVIIYCPIPLNLFTSTNRRFKLTTYHHTPIFSQFNVKLMNISEDLRQKIDSSWSGSACYVMKYWNHY